MAVLLERVPVDRINRQAVQVHPGRVLLAVLGGLFYAIGWAAAKGVAVLWLAAAWVAVAVQVGWQDGRRSSARHRASRGSGGG